MLVEYLEIIGEFEKECRTDRDGRKVISARTVQVAVIPQEVGTELERLGLIGSILAIFGMRLCEVLEVGKRWLKGSAGIVGPAGLVISVRKKAPRSGQQKAILGRAGYFADDLFEVITGLLEVDDRIVDHSDLVDHLTKVELGLSEPRSARRDR